VADRVGHCAEYELLSVVETCRKTLRTTLDSCSIVGEAGSRSTPRILQIIFLNLFKSFYISKNIVTVQVTFFYPDF